MTRKIEGFIPACSMDAGARSIVHRRFGVMENGLGAAEEGGLRPGCQCEQVKNQEGDGLRDRMAAIFPEWEAHGIEEGFQLTHQLAEEAI